MRDHLRLQGLRIQSGDDALVHDVGLELAAGEVVGLVGASGSGKTLTARALLGLPGPAPGVVAGDLEIHARGELHRPYELLHLLPPGAPREARRRAIHDAFQPVRGRIIGLLHQDARGALDPLWTVGRQLREALSLSGDPLPLGSWLSRVGFHDPASVLPLYPHQLSGGMAGRVAMAVALARGSLFLVADEPTTGLDPTVQVEILAELTRMAAHGRGVLLITHDLRMLASTATRILVMHGGRVVEELAGGLVEEATSPEARALVDAMVSMTGVAS